MVNSKGIYTSHKLLSKDKIEKYLFHASEGEKIQKVHSDKKILY